MDITTLCQLSAVPRDGRLIVVGDAPYADTMASLLRTLFAADAEASDAEQLAARPWDRWHPVPAVILVGPRFNADLECLSKLPAATIARWYAMPLPVDDSWGWYEFCRTLQPHLSLSDQGRLTLTPDGLISAYTQNGAGQIVDGNFELVPENYLFAFKGAADAERVEFVLQHLSDEPSRRIYRNVLYGTPQQRMEAFLHYTLHRTQYFDYWAAGDGAVIINCGLLQGFELPYFGTLSRDATVVNIDPIGDSYLSPYARAFAADARMHCLQLDLAAADDAGEIELPVGGSAGMPQAVSKEIPGDARHTMNLQTAIFRKDSIDNIVRAQGFERVDLIKMDIEGGEWSALRGAMATITRHRPALSIAIYHRFADVWSLPEMLIGLLKDQEYDFYCGVYSFQRWEIVLYCIPRGRNARVLYTRDTISQK